MKVFNFGSINIDSTYLVSEFVRSGETISAMEKFDSVGGKGLNQSVALVGAGVDVMHVGAVGASDYSKLFHYLKHRGIDGTFIDIDSVMETGHAIIQLKPDGANSIIVYGGANKNISRKHYEAAIDEIEQEDWVLFQNEVNDVKSLIPKVKSTGATIVLNPSPFTPDIRSWDLNIVDYLILNETELEGLLLAYVPEKMEESISKEHCVEKTDLQTTAERIVHTVQPIFDHCPDLKLIITLGSAGSMYCTRHEHFVQAAIPAKPVDTTGAGDTFTGYFIGEMVTGGNVQRALLTASAASAIAIARNGAAESIPERSEVLNFLNHIGACYDH